MRPLLEQLTFEHTSSFLVRAFERPYFDAPWHYHPEFELTYIVQGAGQRFVADSIEAFDAGDLVLLGAHVPHFWRNSVEFYQQNSKLTAQAVVVQFPPQWVNDFINKFPDFKSIRSLLLKSESGLVFSAVSPTLHQNLLQLPTLTEGFRLVALLDILLQLATQTSFRSLASPTYRLTIDDSETERMKRILEFTLAHFQEEISLETIADVAHLTVPAFCRYFKKRTKKTYIEYLNHLKINHACKLLTTSELSVAQVGLECGFHNLSNFHQTFRRQMGQSPLAFRKTNPLR
ncbi:MAG TPA: AraC family transcriptional regulator [Runella sp.]|nr:AraC family transcriptional regulator [Runella sp.]